MLEEDELVKKEIFSFNMYIQVVLLLLYLNHDDIKRKNTIDV